MAALTTALMREGGEGEKGGRKDRKEGGGGREKERKEGEREGEGGRRRGRREVAFMGPLLHSILLKNKTCSSRHMHRDVY